MMKFKSLKYKLLLIILTLGFVSQIKAGEFEFKVLAKQGQINYIMGSKMRMMLKIGTVLSGEDQIIMPENAYLGLVHKSGSTIELTEAGTYSVTQLKDKIDGNTANLTDKYAKYIVSKWDQEDADLNIDYRKYLKVTGAVERGEGEALNLKLPKYVDILNEKILVKWNAITSEDNYNLYVKNMYGKTIFKESTNKNFIELDLRGKVFTKENILIISVKGEKSGVASEDYALKKIDSDKASQLKEELKGLNGMFSNGSSLGYLALANFYEQNDLIVDALAQYENALTSSPDSPQFVTAYNAFLQRHSL